MVNPFVTELIPVYGICVEITKIKQILKSIKKNTEVNLNGSALDPMTVVVVIQLFIG